MRRLAIIIGILLIAATTAFSGSKGIKVVPIKDASGRQITLYEGSYALVVGVSDYTAGWPKLPSVVDETKEVQAALEANGFNVRRVLNPDEDTLKRELEDFIDQYGYQRDNRLLIFFSGHGYSRQKGAKGYLVPTDAPDPRVNETGFLRKALPMNQILAWCRQLESKHVLFLFDSCFSGTIFKTKALPEIPPHISALSARPVRQFISAGDEGEQVPAKSVFAKCFIRGLQGEADLTKDGYITGSELGMYLRDKVLYYRTGQTPQYGKIRDPDLDEGDFIFKVLKTSYVVQRRPPSVQALPPKSRAVNYTHNEVRRSSFPFDVSGVWDESHSRTRVTIVRMPDGRFTISSILDHGDKESYRVLSDVHVEGNAIVWKYLVPSTGYIKTITATQRKGSIIRHRWKNQYAAGSGDLTRVDQPR